MEYDTSRSHTRIKETCLKTTDLDLIILYSVSKILILPIFHAIVTLIFFLFSIVVLVVWRFFFPLVLFCTFFCFVFIFNDCVTFTQRKIKKVNTKFWAGEIEGENRITESLKLKGSLEISWSNPLLRQGQPKQVIQDCVQSCFEDPHRQRLSKLSELPVPLFDQHVK